MHKRTGTTIVAILALLALVLGTIVPASANDASSAPSSPSAQIVEGKVIDCVDLNSGISGASVEIFLEIKTTVNNNTTITLKSVDNRTTGTDGVWKSLREAANYTYEARHTEWVSKFPGYRGRVTEDKWGQAGNVPADPVCLEPKSRVRGVVQQAGTSQKLANAQVVPTFEDRGQELPTERTTSGGDFDFIAETGTYTVTVRHPCHYDASVTVTVPAPKAGVKPEVNAGTIELERVADPCVRLFGNVRSGSSTGPLVPGTIVTVYDDESHFTSVNATSGPYQVNVTRGQLQVVAKKAGFFDYSATITIPKGVKDHTHQIILTPIGPTPLMISGWVKNGANGVDAARVNLYDGRGLSNMNMMYRTFTITNETGYYSFMAPNVVNSSFILVATKDGYLNSSPESVPSGANVMKNLTLGSLPGASTLRAQVFSRNTDGLPVPQEGARATLYDKEHIRVFSNVSDADGLVEFAVYPGNFALVTDHGQHQSNGTMIQVPAGLKDDDSVILEPHLRDLYNSSYIFARNTSNNSNLFNVSNFMFYRNLTLEHDNFTVRVGLDRAFGRGPYGYLPNDWIINQTEFDKWLAFRKPKWEGDAKSEDFFTVNKTSYDRKATSPITAVNHTGIVLLRSPMKFMLDMNFNTTKLKNGSSYDLLTNTTYDTFTTNHTGLVQVPQNYERTSTNSPFELRNHTRVVVEPANGSGRAEVKFTFQTSGIPTPAAKIWGWNDGTHTAERGAYVKPSTDGKVFFVANATKLIFSGEDSIDATGAILNYKWDFNGTQNRTTEWITNNTNPHYYNETASHLSMENNLTAYLWVMNRGIKTNSTNISVIIDYLDPVAIANATADKDVHVYNGTMPGMPWKIVWANESQSIAFNASFSEDKTTTNATGKDRNGTIRPGTGYKWDWNDNTTNKKDPTNPQEGSTLAHAFTMNGTYNVTLNITDVVGHSTITNMTVVVNDTTKPNVFVEMWELKSANYSADKNVTDAGVAAGQGKENKTYSFRVGKNTRDSNFGTILKWNWMVANPTKKIVVNLSGMIESPVHATEWSKVQWLNHSFDLTGDWTVSMNMTDAKDNWKNETFRVTVGEQARPDLAFNTPSGAKEKLNFSKPVDQIRAAEPLEIRANLSNNKGRGGAANATSVKVKLFVNDVDTGLFWETALMKSPEKDPVYANVSIVWNVPWDTSGARRIKLVAEASGDNGGEHPIAKEDSKVDKEITIKPPVWIETGLPVLGVAIAIILIGLYVMWRQKRWIFSEEARTLRKLEKEKRAQDEEDEEKDKEKSKDKDKGASKKKDEKEEDEEE